MFESLSLIASLAALAAQIVILIASLTRTKDKASDAKTIALEAHETIALLRSEFMMYREKRPNTLVAPCCLRLRQG